MYLIDQHQDTFLHLNHKDFFPKGEQINWDMLLRRPSLSSMTVFPDGTDWKKPDFDSIVVDRVKGYVRELEQRKIKIVFNADELKELVAAKLHGAILHIEGLNDFSGTDEQWEVLNRLYNSGLRSIGVVWNLSNHLGGGTLDEKNTGLSELGKELIEWMLSKRMIVDLAHMNEKTFYDSAQIVISRARPLYISHGNVRILCNDNRNYSDDQLRLLKESGGTMGIFFSGKYLNSEGKASCKDIIDHILYVIDHFGIDHVSIGSDLGGITTYIPESCGTFDDIFKLEDMLYSKGLSKEDVEKVFYKNAMRVMSAYL